MKRNRLMRGALAVTLALVIVFTSLPPQRAQAATQAELLAQIQSLLQQIQTLQAQLLIIQGGNCGVPTSDIAFGNRGTEVTALQNWLIGRGYIIPAGATGYFGGQTQTALQQFQANYGISPALGLSYGPQTRAKMQSLCAPVPTPKPTPTPEPVEKLSGEASLERFTVKDGDDTDLEENDSGAEIMELSFRVEDGDVNLNRIEIGFTPDVGNDEDDPWDVFEAISVWHGSRKIAEVDASRERNWREDSPTVGDYSIRMSGIDYIIREGREVNLVVKVDVQNGVKGTNNGEVWTAFIPDNSIRGLDADRAAVYLGDTADSVSLNIDREGASDELLVRRSDSDPDAGTLQVEDNTRSNYLTVFAFDLDTDDSENNIDIRRLPIELTVSSSTLETFMRDIRLVVDGEQYNRETTVDGTTGVVTFEFDRGDFTIADGDRVTVWVEVRFNALDETNEGVTIVGHVEADDIEAEGGDDLDINQLQGAATGEVHTLYSKGSDVKSGTATAVVTTQDGDTNDYVTFSLGVSITAFGQDVYIPVGSTGVTYELQDATGNDLVDTGTVVVTSSARERNGYFHITEGSTETLTVDVTYIPGVANTTARMQLQSINFSASESTPNQTWQAVPASSFRTPTRTIVN